MYDLMGDGPHDYYCCQFFTKIASQSCCSSNFGLLHDVLNQHASASRVSTHGITKTFRWPFLLVSFSIRFFVRLLVEKYRGIYCWIGAWCWRKCDCGERITRQTVIVTFITWLFHATATCLSPVFILVEMDVMCSSVILSEECTLASRNYERISLLLVRFDSSSHAEHWNPPFARRVVCIGKTASTVTYRTTVITHCFVLSFRQSGLPTVTNY